MDKKQWKINNRNKRDYFKEKVFEGKRKIIDVFKKDKDIKKMREPFKDVLFFKPKFLKSKQDFFSEWNIGFSAYIQGDWKTARSQFKKTHVLFFSNQKKTYINGHEDKPSMCLMNYIDDNDGTCPDDWRGCRELIEK